MYLDGTSELYTHEVNELDDPNGRDLWQCRPGELCAAPRGGWLSVGVRTSRRSWPVASSTSQQQRPQASTASPTRRSRINGAGEITITFAERIVIRGVLNPAEAGEPGVAGRCGPHRDYQPRRARKRGRR